MYLVLQGLHKLCKRIRTWGLWTSFSREQSGLWGAEYTVHRSEVERCVHGLTHGVWGLQSFCLVCRNNSVFLSATLTYTAFLCTALQPFCFFPELLQGLSLQVSSFFWWSMLLALWSLFIQIRGLFLPFIISVGSWFLTWDFWYGQLVEPHLPD